MRENQLFHCRSNNNKINFLSALRAEQTSDYIFRYNSSFYVVIVLNAGDSVSNFLDNVKQKSRYLSALLRHG